MFGYAFAGCKNNRFLSVLLAVDFVSEQKQTFVEMHVFYVNAVKLDLCSCFS